MPRRKSTVPHAIALTIARLCPGLMLVLYAVAWLGTFPTPASDGMSLPVQEKQSRCTRGVCLLSAAQGMVVLQRFYNAKNGLWQTTGWWNAANVLETTIDYSMLAGTTTYHKTIANTFEKNKDSNFLNPWLYDDEGWWALTWIKAYDLTKETRYLDMAKTIFKDMTHGWDSTCGGGIWWHKKQQYKNAIANELFLSIAIRLHHRTQNDRGRRSYLDWAIREWNWFKNSGLINEQHLINDGLSTCRNNGGTVWTYNQGVILGGLVELYNSTNDSALLTEAQAIADAALRHLSQNGILQEICEPDCGDDGPQFKGIFMRNLALLYQATHQQRYKEFIVKNADSIWMHSRNHSNQLGLSWIGPFDRADAARQSSAIDAINAALRLSPKETAN